MDTDEQPAHFAWDLLDAAKQVAVKQVTDERVTSEPARQTKAPDAEAQGLALTLRAPPVVRHEPQPQPAALPIIQPEPEAATEQPPTPPLQLEPTSETAPEGAHQLEPESGIPPMIGQPPATAIIRTEAPAAIEEPSSAQLQPEPRAESLSITARRPESESGKMSQQSLPVRSDGEIPKLSWDDVGKATEPGQYKSRYGLIQVRADEIRIWKAYPNAAFAVMQPSPYSDQDVSRLGSFDVGQFAPAEG
jgi:hypothetical protein